MIDGGKCYACNAEGLVDDKFTLPKHRIEYEPPKWLLEKEKKVMQQAQDNKRVLSLRTKKILNETYDIKCFEIRDDVISCIDSWKYNDESLVKMNDSEFKNIIVQAYEEYLQFV